MKLICLLFLASIVASCNKDPEYYTLETPADQMLLRTSSADLTLEKEKENETAITFTWNAAAQRGGADANIAYFFRMYMADLHSNVTSLYEIEAGERSISFTHNELNDILASWSILPGDKVTIEAEVIAQVNSSAQYLKPELSKTQFDVVGYDKNATAIYMVMITEDGERSMRRMTEKVVGSGIYQSQAELKPCKYFFALSAESDYPCYMKGENGDNSLQYVTEEGDYEMLENTKSGTYTMVVDLNVFDVNIVSLYPLPKDGIWKLLKRKELCKVRTRAILSFGPIQVISIIMVVAMNSNFQWTLTGVVDFSLLLMRQLIRQQSMNLGKRDTRTMVAT